MGTHNYIVEAIKNGSNFRFLISDINSTPDVYDFYDSERIYESESDKIHFVINTPCREIITDDLENLFDVDNYYNSNIAVGFRCFGEMYSKMCNKFSKRKGGLKILSEKLSKIFEVPMEITTKKFTNETIRNKFYGGTSVTRYGKTKNLYGTVTVKFFKPNKRLNGLNFLSSAILGLLKEERIYIGIVDNKINNLEDLVKELIEISKDRLLMKDQTYDLWAFTDSVANRKQLMGEILKNLVKENNDDGSDWYSVLTLTIFLVEFCINNKEIDNYCGENGPSSYGELLSSTKNLNFITKSVNNQSTIELLATNVMRNELSNFSEENIGASLLNLLVKTK